MSTPRCDVTGVVVVGAGIAGIACARELAAAGVPVRVLERASVVGGRMASAENEGRPVDYGAAYFTVGDPEFAAVVEGWRSAGLARPWTSELTVFGAEGRSSKSGPLRWATPRGLRSLVTDLARGLDLTLAHEVRRVGPGVDGEPADVVVLAMPDPQAARLLDTGSAARAAVTGRSWRPVIAVTAGYPEREWERLPAAFVNDHPALALIADDGDRRGDRAPVLVAHTTTALARRYDDDPGGAVPVVLAALDELLGLRHAPLWTRAHRWRYAAPETDRDKSFLLTGEGIGLAGDSWGRSSIETAWRSGTQLGREVVRTRFAG